jgi:hypothetical protein
MATNKGEATYLYSPLFFVLLDTGFGMEKNQDLGINIQGPLQ